MKSSISTVDGYNVTKTWSRNGSTTSRTLVTRFRHETRVLNGNVQGDRKRRIPNPFQFSYVKSGWGSNVSLVSNEAYGSYGYSQTTGPYMPPGYASLGTQYSQIDTNRIKNGAMAKIYDQLRGNNNLIVDLAESSSTLKMFAQVANLKKFVGDFLSNVVKHKAYRRIPKGPTQGQRRLDYVTGKWLEARYGWQPLMYSIYDAADNLDRDLRERFIYVKGRSGQRVESPSLKLSKPDQYTEAWLSEYFFSARCEYGMYFNMPGGPKLSDWTSLNPVGIAYELMTLSFVADWVADIGGYLSLWENNALFSKHFVRGYESISYKEYYTYNQRRRQWSPWVYNASGSVISGGGSQQDASAYSVRGGLTRIVLTALPTPPGVTVKVRFGSLHQLDSLALVYQLFVKKSRG